MAISPDAAPAWPPPIDASLPGARPAVQAPPRPAPAVPFTLTDVVPTELAPVTWTDQRGRSWVGPAGCLNMLDPRPPVAEVMAPARMSSAGPPAPQPVPTGAAPPRPASARQIRQAPAPPRWVRPLRLALAGTTVLLLVALLVAGAGWPTARPAAPVQAADLAVPPQSTPTALPADPAAAVAAPAGQPQTAVPPVAPPSPTPAPTPTADTIIGHTHLLVQLGDTVATLAARAGVDPAAIVAALDGRSTLYAGEWVVLPVDAPPVIPPTVAPVAVPARRPAIASGASFGAPGPPLPTATVAPPTLGQVVGEVLGLVALPTPVELPVPPTAYPHYDNPAITSGGSFGP